MLGQRLRQVLHSRVPMQAVAAALSDSSDATTGLAVSNAVRWMPEEVPVSAAGKAIYVVAELADAAKLPTVELIDGPVAGKALLEIAETPHVVVERAHSAARASRLFLTGPVQVAAAVWGTIKATAGRRMMSIVRPGSSMLALDRADRYASNGLPREQRAREWPDGTGRTGPGASTCRRPRTCKACR